MHHLALACTVGVACLEGCIDAVSCIASVREQHEGLAGRSGRRNETGVVDRIYGPILVVVQRQREYAQRLGRPWVLTPAEN